MQRGWRRGPWSPPPVFAHCEVCISHLAVKHWPVGLQETLIKYPYVSWHHRYLNLTCKGYESGYNRQRLYKWNKKTHPVSGDWVFLLSQMSLEKPAKDIRAVPGVCVARGPDIISWWGCERICRKSTANLQILQTMHTEHRQLKLEMSSLHSGNLMLF